MKSITFYTAVFAILGIGFSFTSCTKDDGSNSQSQNQIENTVQTGNWRITFFEDSGKDETYHFTNYSFTFNTNGTITATNSSNTYNGTWSITDSNSNDDNPSDLDFNIHFNLSNAFEELNEDWHFISSSSTKIELIHISGGNGGTDYLTFERN